ncbi:MAG: PepSY domain-containing protein [Ramlibacter sp.]
MNFLRTLVCAAMLAATVAPAWAAVSRDAAAAIAQRASGGRVLAVEQAESGGRPVWRVKVLTPKGEVRVILVDVASGQAQ